MTNTTGNSVEKPRSRIMLDYSPEEYSEMKDLANLTNRSIRQMIREAVRIYRWYRTRKQEGYTILLEKDGKRTMVDLGL